MNRIYLQIKDIWDVAGMELSRIFHDGGVVLLFCVATLLYPLIFAFVYKNECVRELPIAVVDDSQSVESRRFAHKLDATPEIIVTFRCNNIEEARVLMQQRLINGIVYFPRDYGTKIAEMQTARACLFCDMSSFLYYRSVLSSTSAVLLDEMQFIEAERYERAGMTGESTQQMVQPIRVDDVKLYVPNGGFTSFLVPALLVLVLQQTLFLGMCVLYGTSRQQRQVKKSIPLRLQRGGLLFRVTFGRAMAYFLIYFPMAIINLILLTRLFNLPHIGNPVHVILFIIPFLLAAIFFCMTICSFVRNRDAGIVVFIFFSIILIFISGAIWPQCNMPRFWLLFSYIFPSTHGINGFIRINSMGATLDQVKFEFLILIIQTIVYFFTASGALHILLRFRIGQQHDVSESLQPQQH
ncbi:MAG: ABC transporter permease [Bacteroidales bacterium]|nr:ABC transporter permease [Bacteroidales bacterium]